MNMIKRALAIAVFLGLSLSAFATARQQNYENYLAKEEKMGSATELEGNIVIVSVYADDINYSWNMNRQRDLDTIADIKTYLKIATDYLTRTASDYGNEVHFISENEDLQFHAQFNVDTAIEDAYYAEESMNKFITDNVPIERIQKKYNADSIIFFMFVNTDENTTGYSCTRNYYEGMPYPYEIVFLYNIDCGMTNCPAVYAHEMLHAFGAPDLYYKDEQYGFTDEFMNYIPKNMANDIMNYCSDIETDSYVYDRITNEVSELDAYYAGLSKKSILVEKFGLGKSQHLEN